MRSRSLTFSLILALALPMGLPSASDVTDLLPWRAGAVALNDPAVVGAFSELFVEPTINGEETDAACVEGEDGLDCKPAAGGLVVLDGGRLLYWNALEGTENVNASIVAEFGRASVNDQSRVLDLSGDAPRWRTPETVDGGADNEGGEYVLPDLLVDDPDYNSGALFCPGAVQLADGSIMVVGGTDYYNEPATAAGYGIVELEGLTASRVFDPDAEDWFQTGDMEYGRWYPGLITLGDGQVLVTSGATKLMKPLYPDRPMDSGSNVRQTETFDPETGEWTTNPSSADKTLPLYPRLHLLPNGHVFYNAAGQVFNPMGQSYDQALWNLTSAYDPESQTWTDLDVPGLGTQHPGFRGSTFSVMLPLKPEEDGSYRTAEFLSAGGILGVTPGTYVANRTSLITTVTADGDDLAQSSRATGDLNNDRWYSSGILLPDGSVLAVNGADRDEVVAPGTGFAVRELELFDPETETWTEVGAQDNERTYHNSAVLLPDGRVLIGGHAPISMGYGANGTLPGGFSSNEGRDPSFQIYSPPYLFRGDRPEIIQAPTTITHGRQFTVETRPGTEIESVVLVRKSAATHIVDNDQRSVELPFRQHGAALIIDAPPTGDVAPAGPYMLFITTRTAEGRVPSVAAELLLG
jgi:hypothetical protein